MRPIPLDEAAQLIVDRGDVVHRLDLRPDNLKLLGAQRAAEHEFHGETCFPDPSRRRANDGATFPSGWQFAAQVRQGHQHGFSIQSKAA
jgi:hypothetical protein